MNLVLPPRLAEYIEDKVRSGQYSDANQVVVEALEVMREQEQFTPEYAD